MHKPINSSLISSTLFVFSLLALFSSALVAQVNDDLTNAKETPDDIELFAKAVQLSSQHEWALAEPIYREIIERNQEWPEPSNNLAILLLKTNRIDEAKKMFEQSVSSSPNYRIAQKNRSKLYNFLATRAYDKALGAEQAVSTPELELIETIYQPVKVIEVEVEKIVIQEKILPVSPSQPSSPSPEILPSSDEVDAVDNQQLSERIEQQLIAWSRAWSQGDFDGYIQSYSKDFQPSNSLETYSEWKNIRRAKLKFTQGVDVEIENVRVFIEPMGDYVLVEFIQKYQSTTYQDKVLKQMYMQRQQNDWLILSERTIKTY